MQTASKVEIDNWSDLSQDIMNIRPVGTYTKPQCHCHHHHHPEPWFPPVHEIHHPKPECDCDCECEPHCHHIPVDVQPLPPHFHPVDIDGDGFVENDIIVKPLPPHHHHHHHPVPPCYGTQNTEDVDDIEEVEELQMTPETPDEDIEVTKEVVEDPEIVDLDEVLTDVWSEPKVINTETNEVIAEEEPEVELHEVEEPVKPVRTRRVNRGGRRKKED